MQGLYPEVFEIPELKIFTGLKGSGQVSNPILALIRDLGSWCGQSLHYTVIKTSLINLAQYFKIRFWHFTRSLSDEYFKSTITDFSPTGVILTIYLQENFSFSYVFFLFVKRPRYSIMKWLNSDQIYCSVLHWNDTQEPARRPLLSLISSWCSAHILLPSSVFQSARLPEEEVSVAITTTEKTSLSLFFPTFLSFQAPDSLSSPGNSVPSGKCLKIWLFSRMFTL